MKHGYHAMLFAKSFELEYVRSSICGLCRVENSLVPKAREKTHGACRGFVRLGFGVSIYAVADKRTIESDTNELKWDAICYTHQEYH
jgi:hypothetical protein